MKNIIILLYIVIILLFNQCNYQKNKNTEESLYDLCSADSIINKSNIYSLNNQRFISFLDSIEKRIHPAENVTSVKYFFLQIKYGYNLNHSLHKKLPYINMFIDHHALIKKHDFKDDKLVDNSHFREFLKSYLDLKAKYKIAQGKSRYTNNMFINEQWNIAKKEFSGEIKDLALFYVIEYQITIMGHKFNNEMMDYFLKNCNNEAYKQKIDSLYVYLLHLKSETEERIYKISGNDSLSAYIYYPENEQKNRPCILILHGGGWYMGHPLTRTHIPKQFNELGFVAIAVEHRIKGRQDATPLDGLKDARAAICWVREHANELGINPDKIIAGGLSAGGTLAALTALTNDFKKDTTEFNSKPNAVIMWSGCVDVTKQGWFQYCLQNQVDDESLSPTHLIDSGIVPFLIFQGDLDEYNHCSNHVDFTEKMNAAGNYCELILFENTKHAEVYEKEMMQYYKDFISLAFNN